MEELTNKQVVLLTMLVSFVVSTATGIMTVAMLEEAPQTLTQTVNRVVERTIERVVTGTSTPQVVQPVTTVTKEVTIYAKEDDLVISAVEKNQPRIAKIYGATTATTSAPDAIGFVISRDGMLVTDAKSFDAILADEGAYNIVIGESAYRGVRVDKEEYANSPVAFIKITISPGDTLDAVSFGGETTQPNVAQTAVVLGGDGGLGIFKATLARIIYAKSTSTSTESRIDGMETSARIPSGYEGSLVLNLDGQTIGIVIGIGEKQLSIYPASRILDLMTLVSSKGASDKKQDTIAATANAR